MKPTALLIALATAYPRPLSRDQEDHRRAMTTIFFYWNFLAAKPPNDKGATRAEPQSI